MHQWVADDMTERCLVHSLEGVCAVVGGYLVISAYLGGVEQQVCELDSDGIEQSTQYIQDQLQVEQSSHLACQNVNQHMELITPVLFPADFSYFRVVGNQWCRQHEGFRMVIMSYMTCRVIQT